MCGKWILTNIYYAFGFARKTGCDNPLDHSLGMHIHICFAYHVPHVNVQSMRPRPMTCAPESCVFMYGFRVWGGPWDVGHGPGPVLLR
jgi:hypothetical protein